MEETLNFLEGEREEIKEKLIEYVEKGNAYGINMANERLKYINALIERASQKQLEELEETNSL